MADPRTSDSDPSAEDTTRVLEIVELFEQALQRGPEATLDAFLPADAALRRLVLVKLVHVDLEWRLRAGQPIRVESLLQRFPELAADRVEVLGLIAAEYEVRRRREPGLTRDEYQRRFPEYRAELAARLKAGPPPSAPKPGAASSPARPVVRLAIDSVIGLVQALQETQLLRQAQRNELPKLQESFTEPRGLARELLQRSWLTPFQVNQLFLGRSQELTLGPYVLLERVGEGGMGAVFKARHQLMDRVVALKVIRKDRLADEEAVRRFHREIRAAAQLAHPNVVTAYDASQVGDTHFLVMEFVEGSDLRKLLGKRGPLPCAEACDYVRQAALGLQHAHQRGLVHRDIKPANLLLSAQDSTVKILDMGLARLHSVGDLEHTAGDLTQEGTVMGTPDYMAPEQALESHTVDIRADLYSLGCTLFHLVTGQPPFAGGTLAQKIVRHQMEAPPALKKLRADVPPGLTTLVRKLLAKRPEDRYQTPAEVARALEPFCRTAPPKAIPLGASKPGAAAPIAIRVGAAGLSQTLRMPEEIPLGAALKVAAREALVAVAGEETLPPSQADSVVSPPSLHRPFAERLRRLWPAGSLRWLAAGCGVLVLTLVVWLIVRPGEQDPEAEPAEERYPWQPKDLVGMLGEHRLWLNGGATHLAVSNDGKSVAAGGGQSILIGDAETLRVRHFLLGALGRVDALTFSPDGKLLAAGSKEGDLAGNLAVVRLYDVRTGKEVGKLTSQSMAVHYLAFSADSLRLLSCGADQTVRLWDVRTQAELQCFKGHITPINCAALAPDGQTAVSAGWVMNSTAEDRSAQLWDVKTGKVSKRFKHPSRVDHVAFSDDGSRLFTWCATGSTAREWDVGSGNLVKEIKAPGDPDAAGFSTNGRRVLASYPDVVWRLWDLEGGEKPRRFRFEALPHSIGGKLALCADGNRAVANEHGGAFVWLLDLKTGKEVRPARGHVGRVLGLAFSPDGGQLLTWGQDTTVRLWDAKTRQELHLLGKHEGGVNSAAFSADGSRIVSGGEDGTIRVWAAKSGKELGPRDRPRKKILSVALSRDGRRVLFAENTHNMTDYAVRLWDVDKNKVTTIHAQFPGRVNQVLLSPDGHEAWACDASTLWRWEVDGGKRLPGYEVVKGFTLRHMAYSGDGRQLFFSVIWWGDQNCSVWRWNLAEGKSSPQKLPDWHQANGFVVQFAATWNGEVLATTSRIGALVLSEADSKDVLGEWPTTAFPGGAGPLAFAPDGKRLAVANNHSAVYILDLAPLLARRRR